MYKKEANERDFQYILGYLMTNPQSLDSFLNSGKLDNSFDHINSSTIAELLDFFSVESVRVGTIAQILDERLMKNVLRFLPLTGKLVYSSIKFQQIWKKFRFSFSSVRWSEPRYCALDFCNYCIKNKKLLGFDENLPLYNLIRYEQAILTVDIYFRSRQLLNRPLAKLSEEGYPALLAQCILNDYDFSITEFVKQLKKTTSDSIAVVPVISEGFIKESLLTYVSWIDRRIHMLRVNPLIAHLLMECNGRFSLAQLTQRLKRRGYPATVLLNLCNTIHELEKLGVVQRLAEPLISLIEKEVCND
ncbi:hypothetical protein I5523_08175 [Acinetobacter oleivorans]|uniref:hypothetical protein n=1 Tax=Acinetobacter oleivorans TaxID=1148157 RepID=UPI001902BA3C|nr:hypothetical protein [Acinetobacter oleivorans]MBJ9739617.1 hypothetical protein [Acinetobacter oleivorans]MCU4411979.1 hypothetical protein [Acinetobacter oleivorans]